MDTLILNSDATPLSHVPLSIVSWQSAIRMFFLGKVHILKSYDDWVIRSQKLEMKVPSIVMMINHVKWTRGIKYCRGNVYLRDNFTCQLQKTSPCKELHGVVNFSELTLDHVTPKSLGGKTNWINVCTSCKECNSFKSDDPNILPIRMPYKPTYYEMLAKRKKLPVHVREAEWSEYLGWPEELIRLAPQE